MKTVSFAQPAATFACTVRCNLKECQSFQEDPLSGYHKMVEGQSLICESQDHLTSSVGHLSYGPS